MLSLTIGAAKEKDLKALEGDLKRALKGVNFEIVHEDLNDLVHFTLNIGEKAKTNKAYKIKASSFQKK